MGDVLRPDFKSRPIAHTVFSSVPFDTLISVFSEAQQRYARNEFAVYELVKLMGLAIDVKGRKPKEILITNTINAAISQGLLVAVSGGHHPKYQLITIDTIAPFPLPSFVPDG